MIDRVRVVLVRPRFPENIGMGARACANMGIADLCLVAPELWGTSEYIEKAKNIATSAGKKVLDSLELCSTLPAALAKSTLSIGTTARTGGWRQNILSPTDAALLALSHLENEGRVAFVFGSEDKGLENSDIELCTHLVSIPTALEASSLNLAQAVLILLYELRKIFPKDLDASLKSFSGDEREPLPPPKRAGRVRHSPLITLEQQELLIERLQTAMQALGSLPEDNSNYFMLPIRRLISKSTLRHNEFSMLMGICTKIMRLVNK